MKRALLSLLCIACAPSVAQPAGPGLPGGPPAPPAGRPAGRASALVVDGDGGTLTASSAFDGGALRVAIPAGALSAPVDVQIAELAGDPPPGLVGSAWQVGPSETQLAAPMTLTFAAPPDAALDDLAVADQDPTGYWFRTYSVSRDFDAGTVSIDTSYFGSWALVAISAQRDLVGSFQLASTEDGFDAAGEATLQWVGAAPPFLIYAVTGAIRLVAPPPACAVEPSSTPALQPMPLSIAELQPAVKLRWAINGRWDVACPGGSPAYVATNFDTLGITNLGCARSYDGPASFDPASLQGSYLIDCGAGGTVRASWSFSPP